MYNTKKFQGLEGRDVLIHMCRDFSDGKNMVEFHTATCAVLTRQQFEQMVEWIESQFETLAKRVTVIH